VTDVPQYLRRIAEKEFESWDKAVMAATGKPSNHHAWTGGELLETLRSLYARLGRYPTRKEIEGERRGLFTKICKEYLSLNEALECAIGKSPRLEVLRALSELTPPGCDKATTSDVRAQLEMKGVILSNQMVAQHLAESRIHRDLVTSGKCDRTTWWKLTPKGKQWLQEKIP
jgi:hypothetical protein